MFPLLTWCLLILFLSFHPMVSSGFTLLTFSYPQSVWNTQVQYMDFLMPFKLVKFYPLQGISITIARGSLLCLWSQHMYILLLFSRICYFQSICPKLSNTGQLFIDNTYYTSVNQFLAHKTNSINVCWFNKWL